MRNVTPFLSAKCAKMAVSSVFGGYYVTAQQDL